MPSPVNYFEIAAKDAPKMQEFYRGLFDWEVTTPHTEKYADVKTGEGGIRGGIFQLEDPIPSSLVVYVEVEELEPYLEKVLTLGGTVIFPPMELPDGNTIAMLADPEGVNIGIFRRGTARGAEV